MPTQQEAKYLFCKILVRVGFFAEKAFLLIDGQKHLLNKPQGIIPSISKQ